MAPAGRGYKSVRHPGSERRNPRRDDRKRRKPSLDSADIQDRDGASVVLETILRRWPWLRHLFADGGYGGGKLRGLCKRSQSSPCRSSSEPIRPRVSKCCSVAGSWSEFSHGLANDGIGQELGKISRVGRSLDRHRAYSHPHPTPGKILHSLNSFRLGLSGSFEDVLILLKYY